LERRNERDIVKLQKAIKEAILHPICFALSLFVVVFATVATPVGLLENDPIWVRAIVYGIALCVFLMWSLWILPLAVRLALERGWPLVLAQISVYLPLAILSAILIPIAAPENDAVLVLTASVFLIIISSVLGLLLFQTLMLPRIGVVIGIDEIWLGRSKTNSPKIDLIPLLDGKLVDRMEANNQYTSIMSNGSHDLVRMPLSAAANVDGLNEGLLVHRSHWVGTHMLIAVKYRSGNPHLVLVDGAEVPVSRKKVPMIKSVIAQKSLT